MNGPRANCPSCGAPVDFRWSGAVQTTCGTCGSILLRHDLDLEKVGEVSQPPPQTSRVQLGAQGRHEGESFTVVGRIAYRWERGGWSEWHIVFSDGSTAWLSDAQDEYAITRMVEPESPLPAENEARPGYRLTQGGRTLQVMTVTPAHYLGVEGELPFEYWDHETVSFADLRSHDGGFGTIDYSDPEAPILFEGEYVDFEALRMTGLLEPDVEEAEEVRTLSCPSCGGSVSLLRPTETVNVGCQYCGSILDAATPGLDILQKAASARVPKPIIPLGAVGRLKGAAYQVLGFQVRTITVEGIDYSWREYLLHSPGQGFRYLSEYDGHWNYITPLKSIPKVTSGGRTGQSATLHGEKFKLFQTATARTTAVIGEFPWEIRVGDRARNQDFVSPPRMVSAEETKDEITWSLGEYTEPAKIWKAFELEGPPRRPTGVFANQPSPSKGGARKARKIFVRFAALVVAAFVVRLAFFAETVTAGNYTSRAQFPDSSIVVMGPFELGGRSSNVQVRTEAAVTNNWIYLDFDLLNVDTGDRRSFGREVSYYRGVTDGESWSEGSRRDRALLSSVPAGRYALRIFPQSVVDVAYTVTIRRDVAPMYLYIIVLVALLVPWLAVELKSGQFEVSRWAESDYPLATSE